MNTEQLAQVLEILGIRGGNTDSELPQQTRQNGSSQKDGNTLEPCLMERSF